MRNVFAITLASSLLTACGPVITASNRVTSPDGRWAAIVESKQWSGPGNDFDATQIKLQQGNAPPFEILGFTHEYATMKVRLVWMNPQHLDIQFGPSDRRCDHVDITFQAIRAADIQITTEPFSGLANTVPC
ncbi:MAG TPA: hypothetical protein VGG92_05475 [Caulobacteraceae bacterium]|jgi:hypothetical protein